MEFIYYSSLTKMRRTEHPVWKLLHYITYTRVERYLGTGRNNMFYLILSPEQWCGMIIWDQEGRVVVIISGIRGSVGDWKEIHMGIRMKGKAVDPMVSCCILYILDF